MDKFFTLFINQSIRFIVSTILLSIGIVALTSFVLRKINQRIQLINHVDSDSIRLPNLEYIDDLPYSRYVNIDYHAKMESSYIQNIKIENLNLENFIGDKTFSSLFDLCGYLLSNDLFKEEFQVLSDYISFSNDEYEIFYYLFYLNKFYVNPGIEAARNFRFGQANFYFTQANKRLELIDIIPLQNSNINEIVNQILLLKTLFAHPEDNLLDIPFSIFMLDKIEKNNIKSNYEESPNCQTVRLKCFEKYIKGVGLFRISEFGTAIKMFAEVTECSKSNQVSDMAFLMIARAYFWENKAKKINPDLRQDIEKVSTKIYQPSFKSDIQYYLTELIEENRIRNLDLAKPSISNEYENMTLDELLKLYIINTLKKNSL